MFREMMNNHCRKVLCYDYFPFGVFFALTAYFETYGRQEKTMDIEGGSCTFNFGDTLKAGEERICEDDYGFADKFVEGIEGCLSRRIRFPPHGCSDLDYAQSANFCNMVGVMSWEEK